MKNYVNSDYMTGVTMLELITALLVIASLYFLAMPHFNQFLMRQDREITLDRLTTAIQYAKSEAIKQGKTITLCGSHNQRSCHKNAWTSGFILYTDPKEQKEEIVFNLEGLYIFAGPQYGTLKFKAFSGDNQTLHLRPNGRTINNGTFIYCPKNKDPAEAKALIINQSGRVYRSTKNSDEEPLTCD